MQTLTMQIRREARDLGFFRIGIAPVSLLPWREQYQQWLLSGMQGEMTYMERQARKRMDPALVLDNAKTLLVLAMNYHTGGSLSRDPSRGAISRYAWGGDYHEVVGDRLEKLQKRILRLRPQSRTRSYVDTGPVMEKVWGAHSALGWMGKHTNLITREQGSWFFIGLLLLDFELEYDGRQKDYCGTCARCLDACPTRAIVSPYVVDARLCISYLTIELRGPIPRGLRPLIGNRIFGCDDCQEACPWNRFAVKTQEEEFYPRQGCFVPKLASLAAIGAGEFEERFAGSPVRRCRREGLARNVAVALGNSGGIEAVPSLARMLGDPHPLVRGHAAWALGEIGGLAAETVLRAAGNRERDASVLAELGMAMESIRRRSGPGSPGGDHSRPD
jgi:epoxyqueuosine reductase